MVALYSSHAFFNSMNLTWRLSCRLLLRLVVVVLFDSLLVFSLLVVVVVVAFND